MKFDQLIREGRDTDAVRLFARQYYEGGKMGHTRMLLLVRVADELDERRELQEAQSKAIVREQTRTEKAERAIARLVEELIVDCPPQPPKGQPCCKTTDQYGGDICRACWTQWAKGGENNVD